MRLFCVGCGKSVSSEILSDVVFRAVAVCPECIERGLINSELLPHESSYNDQMPNEDNDEIWGNPNLQAGS